MFWRDAADLSKRAREVLKWMADHENGGDDYDDGALVVEGLACWFGLNKTNFQVVKQLLECVFISDEIGPGEGARLYVINESGKRWLKGEKPYRDAEGGWHDTMFGLLAKKKCGPPK